MLHRLSAMVYGNTLLDWIFNICTKETIQTCMPTAGVLPKVIRAFFANGVNCWPRYLPSNSLYFNEDDWSTRRNSEAKQFFPENDDIFKKNNTHFVWNFGHTWYINKTKNYLVAKWAVIFEKWLRHVRPSKLNNCSRSKATGLMFLSQRNFQTICLCSFQGNEDQSRDIQNQRCFAHYTPMSISDCEMLGSSGSEAEEENVRK